LGTLQQSRDLRIREAETALRKLSRNLKSIEANYDETVASHEPARHAQEILDLDAQKFRIAKAASDLEIESERLEGDLEMLKERLAELETQGLEGDETVRREREADDATMYAFACSTCIVYFLGGYMANNDRLRLKVYRSLGIDVEADEAGNYNKAVIRNSRKGDVHVVNIDPKFSRFFYANYFWQTMQG
jgi:kinetochore protein Spc24, fungi type